METQDHRKASQSGHEGHGGTHLCHKCGWPFPNPHPSARHRRAHKKVCGTIDGYKLDNTQEKTHNLDGDVEQHVSDNDEHKTPSDEKVVERNISRRSNSGVGSRSSRSTRSEDDVYTDAVTDFVEEASDGVFRREKSLQKITEIDPDSTKLDTENAITDISFAPDTHVKDNQLLTVQKLDAENDKTEGGMLSQDFISCSTNDSTPVSATVTIENESVVEHIMQDSRTSSELKLNLDAGEGEETSSKDLSELITPEGAGNISEDVSPLRDVSEELLDSVSGDRTVKPTGMQTDAFERKVDKSREVDSYVNVHALVDSAHVENVNGNRGDYTDMIEEPDSKVNSDENVRVVALPDALSLQEHPEIVVEDFDHKGGKFNMPMAPDATLAFESIINSQDLALEETCKGAELAKPGESSGFSSQGDVLDSVHFAEDVRQNQCVVVQNIVAEANQTSDSKTCDTKACDTDIGEFKGKEMLEDIESETLKKEISISEEQKRSVSSDNVSLKVEGAILDGGDNQGAVLEEEILVVQEIDSSPAQVDETLVESAPVKEVIDARDRNDRGDDEKVSVEDAALNVTERIGGEDESKAGTAETEACYGSTLPGSREGNIEVSELDNYESHKILDSSNVIVGHLQLESLPTSEGVGEIQNTGDHVGGEECINKDGTGVVVKTEDQLDSPSKVTQSGILEVLEDVGCSFPSSAASGNSCTEKASENVSRAVEVDGTAKEHVAVSTVDTLVDSSSQTENVSCAVEVDGTTKEHVAVSTVDTLVDSSSQTDSLDGNWGSVSALSETKASVERKKDPSEIQTEQQQSSALQTGWSPSVTHVAKNQQEDTRKEEIIAKVTNWGSEKQRTPLKTLLGEATERSRAESPNHDDDNSIPDPQKEEIPVTKNGLSSKTETENVVLGTEMEKEWNSPARYPVNIKTEKRRTKYWAPFLCCSSVNAAR